MKKILIIAAVFIVLITGVYLAVETTTGYLSDEGFAVGDSAVERYLRSANSSLESGRVEVVDFSYGDRVVDTRLGTFVGEHGRFISDDFPLFINNGEYVLTLTGNAKLVRDDFAVFDAFPNMYLSDGRTYDADRVCAEEDYILMLLPNGLYINARAVRIGTGLGEVYAPQNSIMNFTESFVSFYTLRGGALEFSSATALGADSTIKIGDDSYDYHGFLKLLGLLVEKVEAENPEDPFIIIPTEVRVDVEGQTVKDDGSYPPVESDEPGEVDPPEPGEGEEGEVVPGGGGGRPAPYAYRKPAAELGEFTSSVYGLSSSITVTDFAKRIYKSVRVEVYLDGVLYLRKSFAANGVVALSPLRPDRTYEVVGYFDYFDEEGYKLREEFYRGTHTTLDMSHLVPIDMGIAQGDYYPTAAAFVNMEFNNEDAEAVKETVSALYKCELRVGSAVFSAPASVINTLKTSLTGTVTASYVSGAVLASDTNYDYSVRLLDRYGNVLPLEREIAGQTRTCKIPPEATITVTANKVADVRFSVTFTNRDAAALENTYFAIYDTTGAPIVTRLEGAQSPLSHFPVIEGTQSFTFPELDENAAYYAEVVTSYDINDGKGMYRGVTVGSGKLTTLPIAALGYAFFDNTLTNVSQTSLKARFILDLARTDQTLLFLIDRIDFSLAGPAGAVSTVRLEGEAEGGALHALKNGGDFAGDGFSVVGGALMFDVTGLSPATDYTVSVTPYATQGAKRIPISSSLTTAGAKTLRAIPVASVENVYTTKSSIELFNVLITDNDGAITTTASMQIRNSAGALVASAEVIPNQTLQRTGFTGLEPEETYTVSFIVQEINFGYLNSNAQTNYRLAEQYTVRTVDSITGELRLGGVMVRDSQSGELRGENLFDPETAVRGNYINKQTGVLVRTSNYFVSALIPVTEGNTYGMGNFSLSASHAQGYALYDAQGGEVRPGGIQSSFGSVTIPEGVTHIRVSGTYSSLSDGYFALVSSPNEGKRAVAQVEVELTDLLGSVESGKYEIRVFKNEIRAATIKNSFIAGETAYDTIRREVNIDALRPDRWRFELWVTAFDYDIRLDSVEFEAKQQIYCIATALDMRRIRGDTNGYYLVTRDIYTTAASFPLVISSFGGTLDFDGHSFYIYEGRTNYTLFDTLERSGVLKNFRLVADHRLPPGYDTQLISYCYGTVSDFIVVFGGTEINPVNEDGVTKISSRRIVFNLYTAGVVENFSVDLGGDTYCGSVAYALVVRSCHGLVRNGRIFGGDIYSTGGAASFLCYYATNSARLYDVIIEGDLYVADPESSAGGLVLHTKNAGTAVRNIIAAGDVYRLNADGVYEPRTTEPAMLTGAGQIRVFHRTDNVYPALKGVNVISLQALHNVEWYKSVLSDDAAAFSLAEITGGYYPTVRLPSNMPEQRKVELPPLTRTSEVTLETIVVTEQYDEYAVALFSFINASAYPISDVEVEYLTADVLAQENIDGISTVKVRLAPIADGSSPTKYVSSYDVVSFTRGTEVFGINSTLYFEAGEKTVDAEFFKRVSTPIDWANINNDVTQNYRLTGDLYLEELSARDTILFKSSKTFSGKLDGGGYTVHNLDLGGSYSYVFQTLTGSVRNITFDNIRNVKTTGSVTYSGLIMIFSGSGSSVLSNVCVRNSTFTGMNFVGALAAVAANGSIEYCSSVNNTIVALPSTAVSGSFGGLIGFGQYGGRINSCFVNGVRMDGTAMTSHYMGGFVGGSQACAFENCYAAGEIETIAGNAAGFVGYNDGGSASYTNCWADVNIRSRVSGLGGFANASAIFDSSIALGDVTFAGASDEFVYRFRGDSQVDTAGAYAYANQRINGSPRAELMGVQALLTDTQLGELITYSALLGWSELDYDFTGIENGMMPKLRYSDGSLLANQPDHYYTAGEIRVTRVTAGSYSGERIVHIEIAHPAGTVINGVGFDYLDAEVMAQTHNETSTIFDYKVLDIARMLDNYYAVSISCTEDGQQRAVDINERVDFGEIFYNEIGSAAEWQTVMAQKGQNYENFLITGDIDFSAVVGEIASGLRVNRLEGIGMRTVSNASLVANGDNNRTGLLNVVAGAVSNLVFDNINITRLSNQPSTGVISNLTGTMSDVEFRNCTILSARVNTGCVGKITSSRVSRVALSNITVDSTQSYAGALTGLAEFSEFEDITVRGSHVASTVNFAGGVVGYAKGATNYYHLIRVEDCEISGRNYVAGVTGYGNMYALDYATAEDIVVTRCGITASGSHASGVTSYGEILYFGMEFDPEDGLFGVSVTHCEIKGTTLIGGVGAMANGQNADINNSAFFYSAYNTIEATSGTAVGIGDYCNNHSLSEHNTIIAATSAAGATSSHGTHITSRNNIIFGSYRVGGVSSSGMTVDENSLDNIVGTIHDDLFTQITGRQKVGVTDPEVQNRDIGGVIGYVSSYYAYTSTAVNCTVGGAGAVNVGGVAGRAALNPTNTYSTQGLVSLDCVVTGYENVGGIIGSNATSQLYNCSSNSTVRGEYNVGGIAGYIETNLTEEKLASTRIYNNFFTGTVSAYSGAGGLFGSGAYTPPASSTYGNLFAGSVEALIPDTVQLIGANVQAMRNSRVFDGSTVNGAAITAAMLPEGTTLVSSGQLALTATYSATAANGGLGWGASYDYGGLAYGYMPYLKRGVYVRDNLEGCDESGVYYSVRDASYDGGMRIPTGGGITGTQRTAAVSPDAALPSMTFYVSGADALNLEFDRVNPHAVFEVYADGKLAASSAVTERVFTLRYDYSRTLRVRVSFFANSAEYVISPASLKRSLSVWGEGWYILSRDGIQRGGEMLFGEFRNLYKNEALAAGGDVYDVTTGLVVRTADALPALAETVPLWSFEYEGAHIDTFRGFSVSNGSVCEGVRLLVKDGVLFALRASAEYDATGVIADSRLGLSYLTVLLGEGSLLNINTALVLPEGFALEYGNADIAEMSCNLDSTLPYVFLRYSGGRMLAFNYLTGEKLDISLPAPDVSLGAYVSDFLGRSLGAPACAAGYGEIVGLVEGLRGEDAQELAKYGVDPSGGPAADGDSQADGKADADGTAGAGKYAAVYDRENGSFEVYEQTELLGATDAVSVNEKLRGSPVLKRLEDGVEGGAPEISVRLTGAEAVLIGVGAAIFALLALLYARFRSERSRKQKGEKTRVEGK